MPLLFRRRAASGMLPLAVVTVVTVVAAATPAPRATVGSESVSVARKTPRDEGAATPTEPAAASPPAPRAASPEAAAARAREGLEAFRARDYAAALEHFDAALGGLDALPSGSASAADLATLHFNSAACLMELRRYPEAERRFARAMALDADQRSLAAAHAGLAALAAGHERAARGWLERASPADAASREAVERLAQAVTEARRARARGARYRRTTATAARSLQARRYVPALEQTERALEIARESYPEDLPALHYTAAVAAFELRRFSEARRHLLLALRLEAEDPESYELLARADRARGEPEASWAVLTAAARRGVSPTSLAPARRVLLDSRLPVPPGWRGWLEWGVGYDTNPAQSGSAQATGVSRSWPRTSSSFGAVLGTVGYAAPLSPSTTLGAFYSPELLALFAQSVRPLSLQRHQIGFEWYQAAGPSWSFRTFVAGALRLVDLQRPSTMSSEAEGGLRVRRDAGRRMWTEAEARGAWVQGTTEWDHLTGPRAELSLAQGLRWAPFSFELRVQGRYQSLGTLQFTATEERIPACATLGCDGARYRVPLAYTAPAAQLEATWAALPRLDGTAGARFEYRRYERPSSISGPGRLGRKLREDQRLALWAEARGRLAADGSWVVVAGYAWVMNGSNVAYDADDPEHALDYDDQVFAQHIAQVGIVWSF